MLFYDSYKTVSGSAEGIYSISGSKFISYIIPLASDADIKHAIGKVKELQPGASHYCWGCKIITEQTNGRFNDDGEPAGSAGRPILNVILSNQLNNVLIVVVRYFGGTLLGIPGLISAYKTAAQNALTNTKIITDVFRDVYRIEFDYLQMNDIMKVIREEDLHVIDKSIDNNSVITIGIPKLKVESILARFKDKVFKTSYLYSK